MGHIMLILGINKMFKLSYLVVLLILLNAACSSATSANSTVNIIETRARLNKGSITLAGQFLYQLVSGNPDKNIIASATSLLIPLAQLTLWATGSVLEELLKLLNLKSKDEIKAVFPELAEEFRYAPGVEFEVATKYYAHIKYPLSQNFKSDSKKYFDADGENVDFNQANTAAATINDWVSKRTRGKIQDLVNSDMFNEDTRICLVNAIYFLGNWSQTFDPEHTEIKDFHKSNGETVPLKIMYQENMFRYAENDQFQVLKMPYLYNRFSFIVVLPRNKEDLLATIKTLQDPDKFVQVMQSLSVENVKVSLPKMLIKTQIDIKELLMEFNVTKMFTKTNNEFHGILEVDKPVYVSDAIQKAHIAVDESGTEAAAATAITVYPPPKIYEFLATRSFAFYLYMYYMKMQKVHTTYLCSVDHL